MVHLFYEQKSHIITMENNLTKAEKLLESVSAELFGTKFIIKAYYDKEFEEILVSQGIEPRVYLQAHYDSECTETGEMKTWNSGKHYLSKYMTDDEVVKRAWVCFEQAVKHEVMEGFKVEGKRLFNPHTYYKSLLGITMEVKRG